MANLKEIRNRIASVSSTMQITSAMKMVSAAKLKKAQDAITAMRPYANTLTELIQNLSSTLEGDSQNPFTQVRDKQRVLIVAITSNRGLCGAFNANIIKKTVNTNGCSKNTCFSDNRKIDGAAPHRISEWGCNNKLFFTRIQISKYPQIKISRYPNIQISRYPDIRRIITLPADIIKLNIGFFVSVSDTEQFCRGIAAFFLTVVKFHAGAISFKLPISNDFIHLFDFLFSMAVQDIGLVHS